MCAWLVTLHGNRMIKTVELLTLLSGKIMESSHLDLKCYFVKKISPSTTISFLDLFTLPSIAFKIPREWNIFHAFPSTTIQQLYIIPPPITTGLFFRQLKQLPNHLFCMDIVFLEISRPRSIGLSCSQFRCLQLAASA